MPEQLLHAQDLLTGKQLEGGRPGAWNLRQRGHRGQRCAQKGRRLFTGMLSGHRNDDAAARLYRVIPGMLKERIVLK